MTAEKNNLDTEPANFACSPAKRARWRRWAKNNPDRVRKLSVERGKLPHVRVRNSMRERIRKMIRAGRMTALVNVSTLIGCKWPEFIRHIESTWAPWMTWQNYGTWEVDHIIPLKSFDLKDMEQVRVCFHFRNCQALSRRENRAKANL